MCRLPPRKSFGCLSRCSSENPFNALLVTFLNFHSSCLPQWNPSSKLSRMQTWHKLESLNYLMPNEREIHFRTRKLVSSRTSRRKKLFSLLVSGKQRAWLFFCIFRLKGNRKEWTSVGWYRRDETDARAWRRKTWKWKKDEQRVLA